MKNAKHGILIVHLNLELLALVKIYVQIIKFKLNVNFNKSKLLVNGILFFVRQKPAVVLVV